MNDKIEKYFHKKPIDNQPKTEHIEHSKKFTCPPPQSSCKPKKPRLDNLHPLKFSYPNWLKDMYSIDFDLLGDIVLLNNENDDNSPENFKKDPNYY